MHAVVVSVTIEDRERAQHYLHEVVVPGVRQAPGFVAGYWVGVEDQGRSIVVFDSEQAARNAAGQIERDANAPVRFDSVEIGEVVAHAEQPSVASGA